jgi:hypothetical protein
MTDWPVVGSFLVLACWFAPARSPFVPGTFLLGYRPPTLITA